jgi:hypothetical protein
VSNLRAAAVDAVVVVLFVLVGRGTHGEHNAVVELARTAAPFLLGALAGWTIVAATGRSGAAWRSGLIVWAAAVVLGLFLRRVAFERGIARSFVIVTTIVLGALLVGWRAAAARLAPSRGPRAAG